MSFLDKSDDGPDDAPDDGPDEGQESSDDLHGQELARFRDLIRRVREKDPAAQTEFVNRYWAAFKRRVRIYFTDSWMRRNVDESDIVLTLMRRALDTLSVNDCYQVDTPEQLLNFCLTHAKQRYLDRVFKVIGRRIRKVTVSFGGTVASGDQFTLAIDAEMVKYAATTPSVTDVVNGIVMFCRRPDSPREFAKIQWKATDCTIEAKGRPGARFSVTAETTSSSCWITTTHPVDKLPARGDFGLETAKAGSDPSARLEFDDFLARVRELLPADQRYVFDFRLDGRDWQEICELIQQPPTKWRRVSNHFRTGVKEVLKQMGFTEDLHWLEDDDDE